MPVALILAGGFLVLFVSGGARFSIGLTLKPMVDDLGWVRSDIGLAVGLYIVVSAFATFVAGRLADRLGGRAILGAGTVIGIDLVDGADPRSVVSELGDDFRAWTTEGSTFDYAGAVRPPEIVDADRMRTVPLLAGALLVLAAVIGLALAVVVSVRGRRRELAILRALGFTGRQLRTSVRVQGHTGSATFDPMCATFVTWLWTERFASRSGGCS